VWSYDFVSGKTHDGRTLRMLTLIDEYTRECLAIRVARRLGTYEVIEALVDVMLYPGIPENICSDNGPEFVADELRKWLAKVGTGTLYIEPGSPWENGYCDSFNGELRDECLNGQIFYSLREAQMVIEKRRVVYNTLRPHSALGYRPPAPAACSPPAATQSDFAADGCDVDSLTGTGTKTRAGQALLSFGKDLRKKSLFPHLFPATQGRIIHPTPLLPPAHLS
jgi:transposase InsO family protein